VNLPKVLVTGATGFIGCHLCAELSVSGFSVRAIYRGVAPEKGGVEWYRVPGVGPETDWAGALEGVEVVVHLAAVAHRIGISDEQLRDAYLEVNVEGTRYLAREIARHSSVRRLVFISSIGARISAEMERHESEYGRSKWLAEQAVAEEMRHAPADWCVLRPCLVYGAGNPGNMARLIRLLNSGLPLPLGAIRNARSLLYVGNLTSAIRCCLGHPAAAHEIFDVSDGQALSTPELVRQLAAALGRPSRLINVPVVMLNRLGRLGDWIKSVTGKSVALDSSSISKLCNSLTVDHAKLHELTGWVPPYSVDQGLELSFGSGGGTKRREPGGIAPDSKAIGQPVTQ